MTILNRYIAPICFLAFAMTAACGGGTSSNAISFAEINDGFAQVYTVFAVEDLDQLLLDEDEIRTLGAASYTGLAGIGYGADDEGGLIGRLSMEVDFSDVNNLSGNATDFVEGNTALAFDVEGQVDVPTEAGLDVGSGLLSFDGSTGAAVTVDGLLSDFGEVAATRAGEDVAVGVSIYGLKNE